MDTRRIIPDDFTPPARADGPGFHLRMLTVHDGVRDFGAVMAAAPRLRGAMEPGGTCPDGLTLEESLIDQAWRFRGATSLGQFSHCLTLNRHYLKPTRLEKAAMTTPYTPPKVWTWDQASGGQFANINRPIAGPTHDAELPRGAHPYQLYSLATPNGVKVSIMFEELLEAGHAADYDAWLISISNGDQFGSGFVGVNPNSKIPALLDVSGPEPLRVFESGSIMIHLAEKFGAFLPATGPARTEVFNWLMWQMGSAPFLGGGFGHFFAYAPEKIEYAINRYAMEVKRQLDVLDRHLADHEWMAGAYSIADMAIFPWYGAMVLGRSYANSEVFLDVGIYKNLKRWADAIDARPAVMRGRMVNKNWGEVAEQVPERHSASDFAGKV